MEYGYLVSCITGMQHGADYEGSRRRELIGWGEKPLDIWMFMFIYMVNLTYTWRHDTWS